MFQKGNRFYADWRDSFGKRCRKAFTTERDAQLYEAAQKQATHRSSATSTPKPKGTANGHGPAKRPPKATTHPKTHGGQANSARSCPPSRTRAEARTSAASPKRSRTSPKGKRRASSRRAMY